jgi:hypothetical protein
VRAFCLCEALLSSTVHKPIPSCDDEAKYPELCEIYEPGLKHQNGEHAYIARLLLDDKFVQFVAKLPKLLGIYDSK